MQRLSEDQLQAQCVEWFRMQYPTKLICSFPNGGSRYILEAVKLKKTGLKAGMPDLFIPCPTWHHPIKKTFGTVVWEINKIGLFIELKVGKNKISEKQKEVHEYLLKHTYAVEVCYTFDEFVKVVREYFS